MSNLASHLNEITFIEGVFKVPREIFEAMKKEW
jgi:hypothetical protein